MRRLIGTSVMVGGVFVLLSDRPRPTGEPIDPWIVLGVGAGCALASVLMLMMTRKWSFRSLGLMYILIGMSIYGVGSFLLVRGDIGLEHAEALSDLLRAFWIVGVPLFLFGVIGIVIEWVRDIRDHVSEEEWQESVERVSHVHK